MLALGAMTIASCGGDSGNATDNDTTKKAADTAAKAAAPAAPAAPAEGNAPAGDDSKKGTSVEAGKEGVKVESAGTKVEAGSGGIKIEKK